ncbi:hypothetical protein OB2597_13648 [Pseudooceanicola batsensis HTCC2597]|uniref:Phosphoribulokinase/uridine kinase domain-containing protein n=1 Tax=Pseudooceanicola batsensis (strain ATCC BAA-863 / DSM 15984 / KCTC 12145 / HTCC2597) TaxID=252305 RepID=A3TYF8_PSEBH|nr:AAA family ATPase [Pseudooceanicola batsensis]EAQ03192.1 hypothetical protein OB2597_13648 [Pseudooceanicola batsensis HTCC2597]
MQTSEPDLSERLSNLPRRSIVAIAGAPGSGKSTLAERLVEEQESAALLPMDGFHFDDTVLRDRDRLLFKGAQDTFDVGGLRSVLQRLRQEETEVAVPVFDRDLEISRGSARVISRRSRLVVVEGNYLLLDRTPWQSLRPYFDLTVMIEVPEDERRRRLTERWRHHALSPAQIAHKLDAVDLPNGRMVYSESSTPDLVLRQG